MNQCRSKYHLSLLFLSLFWQENWIFCSVPFINNTGPGIPSTATIWIWKSGMENPLSLQVHCSHARGEVWLVFDYNMVHLKKNALIPVCIFFPCFVTACWTSWIRIFCDILFKVSEMCENALQCTVSFHKSIGPILEFHLSPPLSIFLD